MPRILIAGCGYVGGAAAELFYAAGWEVEGWTASGESAALFSEKPYPVVVCDAADPASVAARGGRFDVVIQSLSSGGGDAASYRRVYFDSAKNLLENYPTATLLFTSSTSVYAQRGGQNVDETSPAEPGRETGKILCETEDLVLAGRGIVARLAGLYGPGRAALLRRFLRGEGVAADEAERYVNYVHRDDVAAALFLLVDQRASLPAPRIFNVVDDAPMPLGECFAKFAALLDRPLPPAAGVRAVRKRGESDKRVQNRRLRERGWTPRFPSLIDGLRESVLPSWNFEA